MQKDLIIKSRDKKFKIYGVLDQKHKTNKLIIFVHGLTGHKNEHHFYNAAKFFTDKKFATFRFDLYTGKKGGRRLENCTISTHSDDLNQVISYFKKKFKVIYLVGHSLGGPTVLGANLKDIQKIVLWDPAARLNMEVTKDWCFFDKKIGAYIVYWGVSFIIGKKMIDEWKELDYGEWIKNTAIPLKVICAGQGILKKEWKKIIGRFKNKNELVVIREAGHVFDELDTETKLFMETLAWLR